MTSASGHVLCSCNLTPSFLPVSPTYVLSQLAHVTLYTHLKSVLSLLCLLDVPEVESKTKRAFTRSQRSSTSAEYNISALTDHALQENHVINWVNAWMIDNEPDILTRRTKEAIHIHKAGQRAATNSVMRTTVFLAHLLLTVPRTG